MSTELQVKDNLTAGQILSSLIPRAVLAMVTSLDPGYLSRGHVPKDKTRKQREIDHAVYLAWLGMVGECLEPVGGGHGNVHWWDVQQYLEAVAVERGLMTRHQGGHAVLAETYGNRCLADAMPREGSKPREKS